MPPFRVTLPRPLNLRRVDRGFTLIEVVLALGLSLLLMAALLSAIELYRQVSTTGRSDVERAQLARAILTRIETDIRSCAFHSAIEEDEELVADEETLVETVDPAADLAGNIGVVGDSQTLVMHVDRPSSRLETLTQVAAIDIAAYGDGKSVAYFLAVPGADGLQGIVAESLDGGDVHGIVGLSRLEGDRLSLQYADTTGDLSALSQMTRLLAPEVDFLAFRYFDGAAWYDVWDTSANERLPRAIEVIIGFRTSHSDEQFDDRRTSQASSTYRLVVALPTAEQATDTSNFAIF